MPELVSDSSLWLLVAIALVVVIAFVVRTVSSIRAIARRPAASIAALRLHDRAAGSLGRAVAVVAYLIMAVALSWWGQDRDTDAGEWAVGITAVVTVFALILIERRWPVPGGTVRSADLRRRRLAEVLPRGGLLIAGGGLLLALGLIVLCGLVGRFSSDPMVTGQPPGQGWAWPSWARTAPQSLGVVAIMAPVALAVALLLRRPALAGFDRAIDLAYRRAGVDRILRVVSCYCLIAASFVVNDVKNVVLGPDYEFGVALNWLSVGLILAGLVSIELFRARPPGEPPATRPSVPVAATR